MKNEGGVFAANNVNPAPFIDHTLLRASAAEGEIRRLCIEALQCGFAAVCVNPIFIKTAAAMLAGSTVKIAAVTGFPLGACVTETKIFESQKAVADGADEIDTVISLAMAKEHRYDEITKEISAVKTAIGNDIILKVILEMSELAEEEKANVCQAAIKGGADFLKTSTGFAQGGATVNDVRLMRQIADEASTLSGKLIQIKAAGGIRDLQTAHSMLNAGAARLGTSSGVIIYHQWEAFQCKN